MTDWLISALRAMRFRGKARILDPLIPRRGVRMATIHGYRVGLDLSEHIQRSVYMGVYESWETRAVRRLLPPGGCFVDVGANIGYFTLLAARRVGAGGKVFSVEPSAYAADRLAEAVRSNDLQNVQVERYGLGRVTGTAMLYDPLPDNHSPSMLSDKETSGRQVQVRTLDDCVQAWGVRRIDLLKVDVEGYEPAVFSGGASTLIAGVVRGILCEFNPYWLSRAGTSSVQVYRTLQAYGFTAVGRSRGEPSLSAVENRLMVWKQVGRA